MDNLLNFFKDYIVPVLKQNKRSITTASAAIYILYIIYQKINKPPKKLRHIPYVPGFDTLKSFYNKESLDDVTDKTSIPLVLKTEHGLYQVSMFIIVVGRNKFYYSKDRRKIVM